MKIKGKIKSAQPVIDLPVIFGHKLEILSSKCTGTINQNHSNSTKENSKFKPKCRRRVK